MIKTCLRTLYRTLQTSQIYQTKPRRALMFMPGDDLKKIKKAAGLDLDLAMLDCEDAVAANRKHVARSVICEALNTLQFGRTECGVRTNSVSSGFIEEDISVVLRNKVRPDVIMVPKLDTVAEAETLNSIILSHSQHAIPVIFQTESAIGLINLQAIILSLLSSTHVVPVAVVFGADDFTSDIRASRDILVVTYARQKLITIARAYNLQPIDRVYIEFKDLEGLKSESEAGFGVGFSGKQCIHPSQVGIVQAAFSPTADQIQYARELIISFGKHQTAGKGSFDFRGKMIDRPTLLQAENIVKMSESYS